MTFYELLNRLADRIGHHHIPVRPDAHEIREFLAPDAVHHDLVKEVVRRIYKANRCGHLHARVGAAATLETLSRIRLALIHSPRTDIDQYRFVEELCARAAEFFEEQDPAAAALEPTCGAVRPQRPQADVIYLRPDGGRQALRWIRK